MRCLADGNQQVGENGLWIAFDLHRALQNATIVSQEGLLLRGLVLADLVRDVGHVASRIDHGKVPLEDEVLVPEPRRRAPHRQAAEELVEVFSTAKVVVVGQGLGPERLAESPRSQEDENRPQVLEVADVGRPVHVDEALAVDAVGIGDAVGELEHGNWIRSLPESSSSPGRRAWTTRPGSRPIQRCQLAQGVRRC